MKAGFSIQDISPTKPIFLVGYPHVERISTGIHDPLLASSLYLHNGTTGILLVAIDILQIDPQTARELRKTISQRIGIPESHVFISCTHTHSGPVTMDMIAWQDDPVVSKADHDYVRFFKDSIINAALLATLDLKPVEIAWTTAQAKGVGGNRLSPGGAADPEVGILAIRDLINKKIIALSVIYSMHPTVLHEDSTLVSADFPGYTREYLYKALGDELRIFRVECGNENYTPLNPPYSPFQKGEIELPLEKGGRRDFLTYNANLVPTQKSDEPKLTVLYHTGTSGNQSPRYSVKAQTFDEAKRLGYMLGESIFKSVLQIKDFRQDAVLAGRITPVELSSRNMPSVAEAEELLRLRIVEYERLKKNASRADIRTAECAVFGAEETLTLAKCQESGEISRRIREYMPAEIQVLKIGDCCLVGLPGEIFVEYGLQIKKFAPCKTFVVSLVNGDLQGYIVTEESKESGSYEANNSLFEPESGKIMVDTALKLIEEMK